jgi:hypothetical protein
MSEETKRKLSEFNKGKITPEEIKKKISESNKMPSVLMTHRESRMKQVFPKHDSKPEKIIQIALTLSEIKFQKHRQDILEFIR